MVTRIVTCDIACLEVFFVLACLVLSSVVMLSCLHRNDPHQRKIIKNQLPVAVLSIALTSELVGFAECEYGADGAKEKKGLKDFVE
jgi:hypothetical protein